MDNLIEEIESLGKSEKRTLTSHLEILLIHMLKRLLQNSFWGQICAFNVGFEFFANRLWPIGYVNLRKI
jgi:hypothetical protein